MARLEIGVVWVGEPIPDFFSLYLYAEHPDYSAQVPKTPANRRHKRVTQLACEKSTNVAQSKV